MVEEQTAKKSRHNGKPLAMETELIIRRRVDDRRFLSGIVAGLLGVGGGMILVPVLFQTFIFFDLAAHLQIHMAVASSMAIICFTGSLSARSHFKRGAVDMEVVKSWGAFIAIGALAGAVAARFIAPAGLKIIFAALALSMATRMLLNDNPGEAGEARIGRPCKKRCLLLSVFSRP